MDGSDFITVSNHRCTETIDAHGTIHPVITGRVALGPGDLFARDLRIELSVTRDGRVLTFR